MQWNPPQQKRAVAQLLRHKADINAADELGQTALILACSKRRHDQGVIEALLAAGADVGARKQASWTALHLAAASDQEGEPPDLHGGVLSSSTVCVLCM